MQTRDAEHGSASIGAGLPAVRTPGVSVSRIYVPGTPVPGIWGRAGSIGRTLCSRRECPHSGLGSIAAKEGDL